MGRNWHEKLDQMREIAENHKLTMLQLACLWNLSQPAVKSVIPTIIQEVGADAKPIEAKVDDLASLPDVKLNEEELELSRRSATTKVAWN